MRKKLIILVLIAVIALAIGFFVSVHLAKGL